MKRALTLATRLAGTDGVSLEAAKVAAVLRRLGYDSIDCAGEVAAEDGVVVPGMHFTDAAAAALGRRAFASNEPDDGLESEIEERARALFGQLSTVAAELRPDLLVVQNAWAIPMQLPLAQALAMLAADTGLPVLSHEHDYWWERERFARCRLPGFLERYFPYHADGVAHLSINGPARRQLRERRGLDASLLPNVMDFRAPSPGIDAFNADFRSAAGLPAGGRLFLQPTRVVPRKGIELAIDLVAELGRPGDVLVITHAAGDEGLAYLERLQAYAASRHVTLRYLGERVAERRATDRDGRKRYALADAYPHADFVTYPSLYEGFGNALLETIYFGKPALVNRYPVYVADVAPKGFRFVEIDGRVTPETVAQVSRLLERPAEVRAMTEHNLALARRHYSLEAMQEVLETALAGLGARA